MLTANAKLGRAALHHLTEQEFCDFVRGLTPPAGHAHLHEHLMGCQDCTKELSFYQQVFKAAYVPSTLIPADVVAQAKSLFKVAVERQSPKRAIATQIFPAAGGWVLAGVRSAVNSGVAKHAVFQWVDYFVDVRTEVQPETISMSLVGQLANQADPEGNFESVRVRLMAGQKPIANAKCNRLGEFALTFTPARRLHLEIDLPERRGLLRVPLKVLNPEGAK